MANKQSRRTVAVKLTDAELHAVRRLALDLKTSSIEIMTAAIRLALNEKLREVLAEIVQTKKIKQVS